MSVDREIPSATNKEPYFCKICQVAFLNSDGLHSHYKDEKHIKMEEADYCQTYGKNWYNRLQDYISCPIRREPLIGLQYIVQLCSDVDSKHAFHCTLCNLKAPLLYIIKHIEGFNHRINYLSIAYKHLLPLCTKPKCFRQKKLVVREHAIKVEQQEKTFTVNDSKSSTPRIGVKSDFWKYNVKIQEKLAEYKKKLSAYETQKINILQYMETLVITCPEEATLVQYLIEEMEAAVNVFHLNTKRRHKSYKRERERSTEDSERGYSRHSDNRNKRRSIWYEEEHKPSTSSLWKDEKPSILDKHSATEEGRSSSASKDMLLRVTFSTGSENEAKTANVQKEHQKSSASPAKVPIGNSSEATEEWCYNPIVNTDLFQDIRAKHIRKYSTDVAKWESLFASHRPEINPSIFSWGPKSPLNAEVNLLIEKKENTRRVSLDALSTFTLFSQERHGSASCQPGSETFSSPQHEVKQEGNEDQELPCSSDTVYNEAGTLYNEPEHDKFTPHVPKPHWISESETSCDQLSDVNANVAQAPESSHVLDASSEYSDSKACGSRHLDTKTDSQDADSNILSNTLTSGKLHASGRQLSSEVLQLLKGKDTDSIVPILKTLSPFYPALQELDLEVFAKELSKTGAITE